MRRVATLLLLLAAASGCRKKSAPEYYELESTHSILVAREGDDAYAEPEMDRVLAGLEAISPDAVEGPKATALAATIKSERERLAREEREREAAVARASAPDEAMPSTPSMFDAPAGEARAGEAEGAPDAGAPTRPWAGMSMAEAQKLFGACLAPGPGKTIPGQPEGATLQVRDEPKCRATLGTSDPATATFYVFVKDALVGQATERSASTQTVKPRPLPPGPDAGEFLLIPGAPAPEGYTGIPGAPQAAPVPAPEY